MVHQPMMGQTMPGTAGMGQTMPGTAGMGQTMPGPDYAGMGQTTAGTDPNMQMMGQQQVVPMSLGQMPQQHMVGPAQLQMVACLILRSIKSELQ